MSGDAGAAMGVFLCGVIFGGFLGAGSAYNNRTITWEGMLVDNPHGVAAIRSRVLAERAEAEAVK